MTKVTDRLDLLPFPALALDEGGEIFYRNRLAKRLLPPLSKLKKQMGKSSFPRKGSISQVSLDNILYFAGMFSVEGADCVFFLENFLPFHEGLSRLVLEESNSCFWDLLPNGEDERKCSPMELDGVAARTHRLRCAERDYLRLLQLKDKEFKNVSSCSLQGFFKHLANLLVKRGIRLENDCPAEASVSIDPSELIFIVLNLVHFAYLFEGEDRLFISVEKQGDCYRIAADFSDPGGFLSVIRALLLGEVPATGAIHCIPFLCLTRVCDKERFSWSVREKEGKIAVSFLLPASDFMPDTFLSDAAAKEVEDLIRAEKEYFS
jgi:hypothetical protein